MSQNKPLVAAPNTGHRRASRRAVLGALHLFDRAHPIKLTRDAWSLPEVAHFDRAVQALVRDLDERDIQHTDKQREHHNGRVLRSADAVATAAARLSARAPWLAARLYRLAFGEHAASYRALRRDAGLDETRGALTSLRWALYRGVREQARKDRLNASRTVR